MSRSGQVAVACALFAISLVSTVVLGTVSGFQRDANVYGGTSETLFPMVGVLTLVLGALWVLTLVREARGRRAAVPSRLG